MEAHPEQLAGYRTSKGTVHFAPEAPLSDEVVTTLVKARITEIGHLSRDAYSLLGRSGPPLRGPRVGRLTSCR